MEQLNAVAPELALEDIDFPLDDMVGAKAQVLHGDVLLDRVTAAVKGSLAKAGQVDHGFPQGLAGNGPGVQADTTHHLPFLDYGGLFAQLGGLDGRAMTGGSAANDQDVIAFHSVSPVVGSEAPAGEARAGIILSMVP